MILWLLLLKLLVINVQYLDPQVFVDMNSDVMTEIYKDSDGLKEYKETSEKLYFLKNILLKIQNKA